MFSRLLVAYDGSEESKRALEAAFELAIRLGAEIFSVSVEVGVVVPVTVPGYGPTESEPPTENSTRADKELRSLSSEVTEFAKRKGATITATAIAGEDEVTEILEAIVSYRCDLLVIGLRHRSGVIERLFPHTGAVLEQLAPCSILAVK